MNRERIKNFTLEGLDCANCAASLEKTLAAQPGVRKVSIDFATLSMRIEAEDMEEVKKVIAREEPEVTMQPKDSLSTSPEETEDKRKFLQEALILGTTAVLMVLGLLAETFQWVPETPWTAPLWFGLLYLVSGASVLTTAGRNILKGQWLDETFLMALATMGALALGEWEEAVGVMVFWRTGELLQDRAVAKSRQTIRSLASLRAGKARRWSGKAWEDVPTSSLVPGDRIQLHPGDRVPADALVLSGEGNFDTAALTGEPLPRRKGPGEEILAGYSNLSGLLEVQVQRPEKDSAAARILTLVEEALHSKARPEKLITRFARIYTPVVVFGALVLAFLPPLFLPGFPLEEWVRRALILLVISCPCALVLGIPLSYFAGLGGAARMGVLFKGANFLELLGKVKSLTFDKTGTLTKGQFALQSLHPTEGTSEKELLSLAVHAEGPSPHPLAHSLRRAWEGSPVPPPESFTEKAGHGVEARWADRTIWAGSRQYMEFLGHKVTDSSTGEATEIHVADTGGYRGVIRLGDLERPELSGALADLRSLGVGSLHILSGDHHSSVGNLGARHGFTSARGSLLPGDKLTGLEQSMVHRSGPHGYVGDGINDAPVLARADVGIAMGRGGTEAALEAADVALMDDDLSLLPKAIHHARKVNRLVVQNIVFALGIKVVFLSLGALGMANLWMAVVADVGAALLVVANSLRGLRPPR